MKTIQVRLPAWGIDDRSQVHGRLWVVEEGVTRREKDAGAK